MKLTEQSTAADITRIAVPPVIEESHPLFVFGEAVVAVVDTIDGEVDAVVGETVDIGCVFSVDDVGVTVDS